MAKKIKVEKTELVDAFNKWMDNYINHPEDFRREFQSIVQHLEEKKAGKEPTYGDRVTEYLLALLLE